MTQRQMPTPQRPGSRSILWWALGAMLIAWLIYPLFFGQAAAPSIPYSSFLTQVDNGNVSQVLIQGDQISGTLDQATSIKLTPDASQATQVTDFQTVFPAEVGQQGLIQELRDQGATVNVQSPQPGLLSSFLISWLPFILIGVFVFWLVRRAAGRQSQIFDFGRSKARRVTAETTHVTFEDVAGQDDAKQELSEVVDFLREPRRFERIGAKLPKGVLLVGPPGTGKTLLARAVAGEAGVPFFNLSATEFIEMFVGVGASRVRDLFEKAKKRQPSIIFIDELDAIGRRRGSGIGQAHDEREQTLNQLLNEMDGFEDRQRVVVIAATNRPDVLDPALLRPGRFDREVTVGLPDLKGRKGILEIHTRERRMADDVDLESIARAAMGMSGADLANVANEAALVAVRSGHEKITNLDLDAALDKVILGGPRQPPMAEKERRLVANHEAGHALVAWHTEDADPVRKVSIVGHGRTGGATTQLPEERKVYGRDYLKARLAVLLGGRVAEQVELDEVSTGAEADLSQATKLARRMVTRWGMGNLPPVSYQSDQERPFLGYELATDHALSDETASRIDHEVETLLEDEQAYARSVVEDHRDQLEQVVKLLMEEETVTSAQLRDHLGPPASELGQGD